MTFNGKQLGLAVNPSCPHRVRELQSGQTWQQTLWACGGRSPLLHQVHEGTSARQLRLANSPRRVPVGFRKMPPAEDLAAESARLRRLGPLPPGPAASRSLLAVGAGGCLGPSLELGCSKGCSEVLSEPVEEPEENARMLRSLKGVCWGASEACKGRSQGLSREVGDCPVADLSCDCLPGGRH